MAAISTTPPSMPYQVWVFVLGPSSGPRRMLVRREPDGYVGIKADEKVFTPDALIKVTVITIDQKIYRVYFEEKVHNVDRTKAKYVFMRLHNSDYAIDVSVEDDLPIFLDCLTKIETDCPTVGAPAPGPLLSCALTPLPPKIIARTSAPRLPIATTVVRFPFGKQFFMPTKELIYELLDHLNVRELVPIAALNSFHTDLVRKYIAQRFAIMAGRFFTNTAAFSKMLTDLHAVVSGSAALHLMLAPKATNWIPRDLDIYVSYRHEISIYARMLNFGYFVVQEQDADETLYIDSFIKQVTTFFNGVRKVQVMFTKTSTAFVPIFEFHSTAVMNFVSPSHLFSAYPDLTLNRLSMINPGAVYFGYFNISVADALRKYRSRGFRYVNCDALGGCSSQGRTLTDSKGFWLSMKGVPSLDKSASELFASYDVVDVHWILGGRICGVRGVCLQPSFVLPRVDVIDNESSILQGSMFEGSFNMAI